MFIAIETTWLNGTKINKERRKEQSWQTHPAKSSVQLLEVSPNLFLYGWFLREIFIPSLC